VRLPRDYIERVDRGRTTEAGAEALSSSQRADEALMLGLRLTSGIDRAGFRRRFGADPVAGREAAATLAAGGLLRVDRETVAVPSDALFVSNEILSRLL
jgi:oxygen-independent coproporphyrinogen-3 oxidase